MDGNQVSHGDHHGHHSGHMDMNHDVHHPIVDAEPSVDSLATQEHGDHQSMMSNHHMMMMMYFHGGYDEVILFDAWRINSIGGLIGSMFACFVMAIAYEGLKSFRELLMRGHFKRVSYDRVPRIENGSTNRTVDTSINEAGENVISAANEELPRRSSATEQDTLIKVIETNMCSHGHLYLTLLHFVQLTLSYFLMLIVMTFNTWLCLAVVLGATVGYFLFGWRKSVVVDMGGDHCH